MKSFVFLSISFLLVRGHVYAQGGSNDKLSISFAAGRAIPVGSFGNKDIVNSAIYTTENVQNPWIIGIDKSKSGFAEPGYFANLEMKYLISQSVGLRLRTGYTFNSVYTTGITQFLTTRYGDQQFEHDNYQILHIAPGLGYEKKFGNFNLGVGIFSGLAFTNYPYYESILFYTTTDPPLKWAHDGNQPNLTTPILGGALNINYQTRSKLSWGFELSYQNANFDYSMSTRVIPGSSPNPVINDKLKTSALCIGLHVQYDLR